MEMYDEWMSKHIVTYVALSPPLLGAVSPFRAIVSGEPMGLPISERKARRLEVTFGSSLTALCVSTSGFRDWPSKGSDVYAKLKDRDWGDTIPLITVTNNTGYYFAPKASCDVLESFNASQISGDGTAFSSFATLFPEDGESPLKLKPDHLKTAFRRPYNTTTPWTRPKIKNIIVAYGINSDTEIGYNYEVSSAADDVGFPRLMEIVWESKGEYYAAKKEGAAKTTLGIRRSDGRKALGEAELGKR